MRSGRGMPDGVFFGKDSGQLRDHRRYLGLAIPAPQSVEAPKKARRKLPLLLSDCGADLMFKLLN